MRREREKAQVKKCENHELVGKQLDAVGSCHYCSPGHHDSFSLFTFMFLPRGHFYGPFE
jgi:hypothetical protein